jgi:hypothetical protein
VVTFIDEPKFKDGTNPDLLESVQILVGKCVEEKSEGYASLDSAIFKFHFERDEIEAGKTGASPAIVFG